jgi:F0F1-type ATP synthase epsilon subunit
MAPKSLISLIVRDTNATLFEGSVDRISSYNEVGAFDIYPMHANFISILQKEINIYLNGKIIKNIKIDQAVLKTKRDHVEIFVGIESLMLQEEKEMEEVSKS